MAESSSDERRRVACDACGAEAWIGAGPAGLDAWCEACQRAERFPAGVAAPRCPACGGPLATGALRFPELWGAFQDLDAVLAAWAGDAGPLGALLPERPRFLTDLSPPDSRAGDSPALAAVLEAAHHGDWPGVLASPAGDDPRAHAARAIAHERRGEAAAAIADWSRALASGEWEQARLSRGVLHARMHAWDAAAADFALAGSGHEARWNRASLRLHRAVAATPGLPDPRAIAAARVEAGPASEYWSDHTVGRLAFTLVAERARARREAGELSDLEIGALRDAEELLEHRTFWDRAMVLVAHARLALEGDGDAARVAQPLAREIVARLLAEPPLKGAALAPARLALEDAREAIERFEPREARAAFGRWLADEVLRRYRLPCAACGRGSVGVEGYQEGA